MAHVAFSPHPQLDFPRQRPVADSPSAIGFGFTPTWNPSNLSHSHSAFASPVIRQQLASHMSPNVPVSRSSNKRRLEEDENDERGGRDDAMDRSPTPERRRVAIPKRTRLAPPSSDKNGSTKESKSEEDVDVGVLLGQLCLNLVPARSETNARVCSEFTATIAAAALDVATERSAVIEAYHSIFDPPTISRCGCAGTGSISEASTRCLSIFNHLKFFFPLWLRLELWCSPFYLWLVVDGLRVDIIIRLWIRCLTACLATATTIGRHERHAG